MSNLLGLRKAIKIFGSHQALANAIGAKKSSISYWLNEQRKIPLKYIFKIEEATQGKVRFSEVQPDKVNIITNTIKYAYKPYEIAISSIILPSHLKQANLDLELLINDIKSNGLNRPIGITSEHELLYGVKRLCAYRQLGHKTIVAHIIQPETFLKLDPHVYGLIAHCTLSERAAIGLKLEPLIITIKSHVQHIQYALMVGHLCKYRPDINIKQLDVTSIVARLLQFSSNRVYVGLKQIIHYGHSALISAVDHGELSIEDALYQINNADEKINV